MGVSKPWNWPENSLLNPMYREYLQSHADEPGKRELRRQLRNRVRQGLWDFMYLNNHMRDEDIEQIFYGDVFQHDFFEPPLDPSELVADELDRREKKAKLENQDNETQNPPLPEVSAMIQFIYRGFRMQGATPHQFWWMVLRHNIRDAEAEIQGVDPHQIHVGFDGDTLKAERIDPGLSAKEKYERGMALSAEEVKELKETDGPDPGA